MADCTFVQILNEFIGKKYSLKIQENCSRVNELLRTHSTKVSKQLLGKHGASRQILLDKCKSVAVRHSELSTVALVDDLQTKVSELQSANTSIARENQVLSIKYKEATTLVGQIKRQFDKAAVDIGKLKTENSQLYDIIKKISPQRRFEDKGKMFLEVGKRQQERKLQTLATRVEQALLFSESFGRLRKKSHSVDWIKKGTEILQGLQDEDQQDIQQVLFVMDKFCIGEAAYHELTCCPGGEELPRSYLVKQCKEDLNKLCSIERTPSEASGAAFNFLDELSAVIEMMVS